MGRGGLGSWEGEGGCQRGKRIARTQKRLPTTKLTRRVPFSYGSRSSLPEPELAQSTIRQRPAFASYPPSPSRGRSAVREDWTATRHAPQCKENRHKLPPERRFLDVYQPMDTFTQLTVSHTDIALSLFSFYLFSSIFARIRQTLPLPLPLTSLFILLFPPLTPHRRSFLVDSIELWIFLLICLLFVPCSPLSVRPLNEIITLWLNSKLSLICESSSANPTEEGKKIRGHGGNRRSCMKNANSCSSFIL